MRAAINYFFFLRFVCIFAHTYLHFSHKTCIARHGSPKNNHQCMTALLQIQLQSNCIHHKHFLAFAREFYCELFYFAVENSHISRWQIAFIIDFQNTSGHKNSLCVCSETNNCTYCLHMCYICMYVYIYLYINRLVFRYNCSCWSTVATLEL